MTDALPSAGVSDARSRPSSQTAHASRRPSTTAIRRHRRTSEQRIDGMVDAARVAQRLAVLMRAGLSPRAAWHHLGDSPLPRAVSARLQHPGDIGAAIDDTVASMDDESPEAVAASAIAVCWAVASQAGAPLAPALSAIADGLRDAAATERDIDVALAGPKATAKLVTLLPLAGIGFGAALGFDTIGVLLGTPVGLVSALSGVVFIMLGRRWSNRLVERAQPASTLPGLAHELVAIALSGGAAPARAFDTVSAEARRRGIHLEGLDSVSEVLELSARAGAPAALLLRGDATERRFDRRAESQRQAATLAVRLMLPMGICVLPAFMLLGVVPMVITVVGTTMGAGGVGA